jgi:hypothetical protein
VLCSNILFLCQTDWEELWSKLVVELSPGLDSTLPVGLAANILTALDISLLGLKCDLGYPTDLHLHPLLVAMDSPTQRPITLQVN